MKTLGASIALRNGIEYDFCFEECIASLLPICDEIVVAESDSTDGTRERLEQMAKEEPKIKIVHFPFTNPNGDRMWVMTWTNFARERLSTDYNIQMDADEVLHESAYDKILPRIQGAEVTLRCRRNTFWIDHKHLVPDGECCASEVLRVCPKRHWLPADYPAPEGQDAMNLDTASLDVEIFHYGFLRKPEALFKKERALQQAFFGSYDPELDKPKASLSNWMAEYPAAWVSRCVPFSGQHPKVIHQWLQDRGYF